MKYYRVRKVLLLAAIAALLLVAVATVSLTCQAGAQSPTPAEVVRQAWQRARDLGSYRFVTDLEATISLAGQPAPTNGSRYERLYIEGQVDLPAQKLEMTLRDEGGRVLQTQQGIELRVEGNRTYGRVGSGAWQELEGATDAFAPGQDPLAFLAGATDFYLIGTETRQVPMPGGPAEISFSRYGFTMDGPAFAEHMRAQLERRMAERGGLPPGVTVDVAEAYRTMTGEGEIWIDEAGLPLRLAVDLEYPPQDGEQSRSRVQTDFSGFPDEVAAVPSLLEEPLAWAVGTLRSLGVPATAEEWGDLGMQAGLLVGFLVLGLVVAIRSRSRGVYAACAVTVILSMVVVPLCQSHQVQAFYERVVAQQLESQQQQEAGRLQQALVEAQTSSDWDPLQDPLAGSDPGIAGEFLTEGNRNLQLVPTEPLLALGGTQVQAVADEPVPDPGSDADGDGLSYQEEVRLGTDPDLPNSDLDQLGDGLEVMGFDYNGQHYYTDPLSSDTTNDGLVDTLECWTIEPDTLPTNDPNQGCNLDSDGDGDLDIFDRDNDNDGVNDAVDLSPFSKVSGLSSTNPFQLVVSNLEPLPVLVDLQIRPTNPKHLGYTFSVLDWPTGDTQGQVQRVFDTTFATAVDDPMTAEELETDPRAAYGDMRLIPMLEIRVPYKAGHTRNLPVKPGFTGTLAATTPLEEWLDTGKLDMYGMAANYLDAEGTLGIYVPLNLVEDETGGSNVAFQSHFYYEPSSSDWGNAHEMRVVWWVQMLVDQCDSEAYDEDTDGEFEAWCAKPENRVESAQVVHTYPETWTLTGLSVREDHGLEAAIAFEDPDTDDDVDDDTSLWRLIEGLDGSFLASRDEDDDNERDIDVHEIEWRWNNETNANNGIPGEDPRLWGISKTALEVWLEDPALPHQDTMITLVTTSTREILNEKFLPASGCVKNCSTPRAAAPTLLYATEATARTVNLDMSSATVAVSGGLVTVGMASTEVKLKTIASASWVPYRYDPTTQAWDPYPLDEYMDMFQVRMADYFQTIPDFAGKEEELANYVLWATCYYLAIAEGIDTIVEIEGQALDVENETVDDITLATYNIIESVYRICDSLNAAIGASDLFKAAGPSLDIELDELVGGHAVRGPDLPQRGGNLQVERLLAGLKIGTCIAMALTSFIFAELALAVDSDILTYVQDGLMLTGSLVLFGLSVKNLVGNWGNLRSNISAELHKPSVKVGWALAAVGAGFEIAAQIGLFVMTVLSEDVDPSSIEFDAMLASLIATVIVIVILTVIYNIPIIGDIIYAVVSVLNWIINIVCTALGEGFQESAAGQFVCSGVSGMLSKIVARIIFSTKPILDAEYEGLDQSSPKVSLVDPQYGFQMNNKLRYTMQVTQTIRQTSWDQLDNWKQRQWYGQFNEKNLKKTTYAYSLSPQEADLHPNLSLGQETGWQCWWVNREQRYYCRVYKPVATTEEIPLITPGLNITTSTYYNLGYAVPVQECWGFPPISGCGIKSTADTGHEQIGMYFQYDVFPSSLDGFHGMQPSSQGYRLSWGGAVLQFPPLQDADGDGLVFGPDPSDTSWDADGDGLSDSFEQQTGTDPLRKDTDGDGLEDGYERLHGADPTRRDGDYDGLDDKLELDGWDFVYGWVDETAPKMIHVTSDPLLYDTDLDGLSDKKEWLYGWNPRALSEGKVLSFSSTLSERPWDVKVPGASDGVVKATDYVQLEANVKNELDLRYARGLLSADYPAGALSGSVDPKTFVLAPHEPAVLKGELQVIDSSSRPITLTQIAGAELYDAEAASNYAELLLHLEEAADATTFLDESGGIVRHNGTCDVWAGTCPQRQVEGWLGKGVQFLKLAHRIDVPAADLSAGDLAITFWMRTTQTKGTVLASYQSYVAVALYDGKPCAVVKTTSGTVPACASIPVNDGQWHHLALNYNEQTKLALYVDGSGVGGAYITRASGVPGLTLGGDYVGDLDEVAVYQRALTQEDIRRAATPRPVLYARLDEPVGAQAFVDASGLNTGSCTINCPAMGQSGAIRTAAQFDGVNDYIQFANSSSLNFAYNQDFSVVLWVKASTQVDTANADNDILEKWSQSGGYPYVLRYIRASGGIVAARYDGSHNPTLTSDVSINDGLFHQLAFVKQGADLYLYIDGEQHGWAQDTTTGDTTNTSPLYLGKRGNNINYFKGRIDEVRVYNQGLSAAAVQTLYVNDSRPLELDMDDAPGTYLFEDVNGRQPAACPSNLVGCPTSGVAGRMNQAALFTAAEGDRLATKASLDLSSTSPGATLMAWIYPTSGGSYAQLVLGTDDGNSTTKEWAIWRDGSLWSVDTGYAWFATNLRVDLGRWQHIAVVFNPGDSSTTIYKNGGAGGSQRLGQLGYPNHSNTISVGCDATGSGCFQGSLDEVVVQSGPLAQSTIQSACSEAPQFGLHLEEALHAEFFADYAENDHNAKCSGDVCPKAGVNGQVGLAAEFDGLDDGLRTGYTLSNQEATIMLWARPNSASSFAEALIASDGGVNLELYSEDGTWRACSGTTVLAPAVAVARPEEWQHLALVVTKVGTMYRMTLYLNGSAAGYQDLASFSLTYAAIGFNPDGDNEHFDGRIDEVAIYGRAFSAAEVEATYNYQFGWEEQVLRTGLIIDNDKPTARLVLSQTMVAQQPIQLLIETSDPTSTVSQAVWRVNGGTWQEAPPCEGKEYGSAWCPILNPASSGSYTIEAQATDQVGHVSDISSIMLQVDGIAPTATLDQEGTLIRLTAAADRPYAWTASLSGTVSDAAPSSGVAAVRVALIDPFGVPVPGGSQGATLSGGNWSLIYRLDEPLRTGLYTVQLEAEDQVGNHSAERGHSVALDRTAPEVSFKEQPLPGGGLIMWHLEEAAGATRFLDSSGMGNDGICDLSCPTAGVAGKYGSAVLLPSGGSASLKAIRSLAFDESGLSLSAWFQTSATSQQTLLAATNASTGAAVVTVKLDSSGTVHMTFSPPDAGTASISTHKNKTFNDGAWHHVSAQWHPGQIRLYLDGQVVKTVGSVEGMLPASLNTVVGHDGGTDRFAGNVDEVAIQGVWLNPDEVRSLAFTDPRKPQNEVPLAGVLSEIEAVPDAMLALHLEETAMPPSILLVDDDLNGPDMLPYYEAALGNLGYQYDLFTIYPPSGNGPAAAQMAGYDVVIWFSGDNDAYGGPTTADETALGAFLEGGGSLFLSSQDYLHKMGLTNFSRNYLGVASYQWPVGHASTAYGVPGDPIGGGLGPYPLLAPSQFLDYGLAVNPAAGAFVAFRSAASGGNNLDVDKDGGNWKTVHFGTEWALIQNASATNGQAVMQRILNWFGGSQTGAPVFSDSSVYANDATCASPGCPTADASGPYGPALRFDGLDDGLSIGSSSLPYLQNDLTVMAWIKPEDLGGVQLVLGAAECNQTGGLSFGTNGSGLIFKANGVQDYFSSRVTLAANRWQHVAAVMGDDNSVTFYVDGTARETIAGSAPLVTCTGDIQVGRSIWDAIPWAAFQGSIDEVHVFDRALTADEVLALGHEQNAGLASLQVAYTSDLAGSPLYNAPMPEGVQLYLPLDDTPGTVGDPSFVDISGGGHSGTCTALGCPTMGQPGHSGSAAFFDGMDDLVTIAQQGQGSTNYFSIAAWIYPTGPASGADTFIATGDWAVMRDGSGNINWLFRSSSFGNTWRNTGYKPVLSKWTQIVVVFDGGVVRTYANGELKDTKYGTGSVYNLGTLSIGGWPAYTHWFGGGLDDILLFARALPADEIKDLYRGTEPMLYLPFDEGWVAGGDTLVDSSGWENHSTLTSGTDDAANKALPGQAGAYALKFDGNDDYVNAGSRIDLANASFSAAVWARRTAQRTEFLMGQGVGGTNTLLQIGFRNTGRFLCNFYGDDLEVEVPFDTNWHHWACTYDAATNTQTVFRDGVQVGQRVASADFQGHGDLIIGRYVPGGYYFAGLMDDLYIYPRALSVGEVQALADTCWQPATLSGSGSAVMRADWTADLPEGLEGHYRFDVSGWDLFDNHQAARSAWDGVLDTKAPRATLTYEGGPGTYTYRFSAEDWNLDEGKLDTPCPSSTEVTAGYFNAPWYRALTGVTTPDSSRLYSLAGTCQVASSSPAQESLTTCDLYGNCTAVTATPATTVAAAAAPAQAAGQVLILEPAPYAIVTDGQPLTISGQASSEGYLKRLTISVDGKSVLSQKWAKDEMRTNNWSIPWPPERAGLHSVEADLTDWAGADHHHEITFTLDTQPPRLAITTAVLTSTHAVNGHLPIQGTAADENGIAAVKVRMAAEGYGSDWTPATLDGEGWQALLYPGHGFRPDGELLSISARATDRAGWTSTVTEVVTADLQPPTAVELAISYDDGSGAQPITQTGVTIAATAPVLDLRWAASSDGSGLAGYQAGWIVQDSKGVTDTLTAYGPAGERLASVQPGEACRLTASLTSFDTYGNPQSQAFGPIYADSPLTPDYIRLEDAGEIYRGWMEEGCSLLGRDRRAERMLSASATRDQEQALYATWDERALRLAWTGANWSGDGDLFVYLDTQPLSGTLEVLNPYTPTAVTLSLPGMTPLGAREGAMYADSVVWVQDAGTAWLYRWDGAAWAAAVPLSAAQYRFDPGLNGGQTDLYLPFELLGVDDPAGTPLKLVALATEEGALRLWAVLPQSNPVTSSLVTGLPQAGQVGIRFALNHPYSWDGLPGGICPNGSQALAAGQRQYTDDDLRLSVTVDPAGAVHRYLGDHLFAWWQMLFGDRPAEFSSLLARVASDHTRLRDGQEVVYSVQYENGGADAAQDVVLQVRGRLALILPDGVSLEPEEHIYYQEIPIGDVAPGEAGTVTVRGRVDLAWAESAYQACLAEHPDHPLACAFHKRWALLGIRVFDQAHATTDGPREWMWVDHRVDSQPPLFVGLLARKYGLLATAGDVLRGYAYDESGVTAVTLEVEAPDGTTRQWVCDDPTPLDGQWNCGLDLAEGGWAVSAEDGDVYRIRFQAQDGAGLVSDWSPWRTFVVDRTAPEVVASSTVTHTLGGRPRSLGILSLDGQVRDNYGLQGVEVCLEGHCVPASTHFPVQEWSYADSPVEPEAIGACGGGELVREFTVPENYEVGEIRLGLQAEIADRDGLVVRLTSPRGTSWELVGNDFDLSTNYANWNVVLADSALAGLHALRADQPLISRAFGQTVRPLQPLAVFRGEAAGGAWRLSMCDAGGGGERGEYHGAQLWVDPPNTAPLSGTWHATHQFGALDDVEQTLLVYGIDEAGNRSPVPQALTFRVDNVTPVLTVTQVVTQVQMQPDLAPVTVLAGTAADGGTVARLHAYIRDPEGIGASSRPVVDENLAWHLPLQPMMAGSYQVWVAAEDEAGNLTTAGPFSVEVTGIVQPPAKLYLPLIFKGSSGSGRAPEPTATASVTPTLTITLTVVPTATMTPTVTITPTATITPTVVPTSTITPTATVTPTATGVPSIQPTGTITPTLTLTPTVTVASTGTMALAPTIIVAVPRPRPGVRPGREPCVS